MEQVRSFIAIELPDELKAWLNQLQIRLKSGKPFGVKWVNPYGVHLTLKFLGDVAVDKMGGITTVVEEAARGVSSFHLEVGELGAFPNLRRAQVVWVGLTGEADKLAQLQKRLDSALAPLGFVTESRSFTPHLTLARLRGGVSLDDRQKFGQLIAGTVFDAGCTFEVDAISLMRSQLTREGAVYSRLCSRGLEKPLSTATG